MHLHLHALTSAQTLEDTLSYKSEGDATELYNDVSSNISESTTRKVPKKRRKRRHIPHRERPEAAVQKRNERERKRVDDVNMAFRRLGDRLEQGYFFGIHQTETSKKRLSKIGVLQGACSYIQELKTLLKLHSSNPESAYTPEQSGCYAVPDLQRNLEYELFSQNNYNERLYNNKTHRENDPVFDRTSFHQSDDSTSLQLESRVGNYQDGLSPENYSQHNVDQVMLHFVFIKNVFL